MITYVRGNLFDSPAQVLTNTINCVGAMGKGIALEFKNRFPIMFEDYLQRSRQHKIRPGIPYLWENDHTQILNFPTKRHWRDNSRIDDIENGLRFIAENYQKLGIFTLAMPPLGCGQGNLRWNDVKSLMEEYLGSIPDLEVFIYEPKIGAISTNDFENSESKSQPSHSRRKIAASEEIF